MPPQTLFSHPGTGGRFEYSGRTLKDVRGVSNKLSANAPWVAPILGAVIKGVGSRRERSEVNWGVKEVCPNWGAKDSGLLSGAVVMATGASNNPSKSAL